MSDQQPDAQNPEKTQELDWVAIKREYELGQLSVREIARQAGIKPDGKPLITEAGIRKRANKEKWVKASLAAKVRKRAQDELVRDAAGPQVRNSNVRAPDAPAGAGEQSAPEERDEAADEAAIEAAAQRVVEVVRSHRVDIKAGRNMVATLLAELKSTTAQRDEIEQAIIDETAGDDNSQRRNAMLRAVSLPSRAQTLTSLSIAMTKLVSLERQAFNVDDEEGKTRNSDVPLEERLRMYEREDAIDNSGGKVVRFGEKREAIDPESKSTVVSRETQEGAK